MKKIFLFFLFSILIQADTSAMRRKSEESSDDLRESSHSTKIPKKEEKIACEVVFSTKLMEEILRYALDCHRNIERDETYMYSCPGDLYFPILQKNLFNFRLVNRQFNSTICTFDLLTLRITKNNLKDFYEAFVNWPKK